MVVLAGCEDFSRLQQNYCANTGSTTDACRSGSIDAGVVIAVDGGCAPKAQRCTEKNELAVCEDDGVGEKVAPCPDDGDPCTVEECAPGTSLCGQTTAPNGLSCSTALGIGVCADGTCRCGKQGEPCCSGTGCEAGLSCENGTCGTCGAAGQVCCANSTCNTNLSCTSGTCQCGGAGQTCCGGTMCASNRACVGAVCSCLARALSVGASHTCARKMDGSLWCWGDNNYGQLGDGTTITSVFPPQAPILTGVTAVAAGTIHTCAHKADGTLWCWGANNFNQLGDGTNTQRVSPVQVMSAPGVPFSIVTEVATGAFHTCARKMDYTLWCWGWNNAGQLGDGTNTQRAFPVQVNASSGSFAQVSAGEFHTCARKTDGSLWCWGSNGDGRLGDGTTVDRTTPVQVRDLATNVALSNIAQVAVGATHTCARKIDGTLWCWGRNFFGQLGDGTTTNRAAAVQVTALSGVVDVSAGNAHTCAAKSDNTVWCWGTNGNGRLGDGTTVDRTTPVQVSTLSGVAAVAAGTLHGCARKSDGTLWCWGGNSSGQLGVGASTGDVLAPIRTFLSCP
ncbi:MAG: hypothetical protein ACOZIN_09105 [Myxococcota bacterium]